MEEGDKIGAKKSVGALVLIDKLEVVEAREEGTRQ